MSSIQVNDLTLIHSFISDPAFPYLISFPRTGSHWLRMMMELYFEVPSLVRIFYFKDATEFTCYHRHDEDLSIVRQNVIYLYRHPVDTVYSQLNYYREDPFNPARVEYWATLYGRHLHKWLIEEMFTTKKTILTYEEMRNDLTTAFARICKHFDVTLNKERLATVAKTVTKTEVHKRTVHDPQVVNLTQQYSKVKERFQSEFSGKIMRLIYTIDPGLTLLFTKN